MKITIVSFLALAAICVMLSSCSSLEFVNPQPVGVKTMKVIDEFLLGTWIDDEGEEITIGLEEITTPDVTLEINKDFIIRTQDERYYFNVGERGAWTVLIVEREGDELNLFNFILDEDEHVLDLEAITKSTVLYDENGEFRAFQIDPTAEEFRQLEESNFVEKTGPWKKK